MARRKQPSGRGFDLAFEARQKQQAAAHQERCELIQRLSILLIGVVDSLEIKDDVMIIEDDGHKFEVKEKVEG